MSHEVNKALNNEDSPVEDRRKAKEEFSLWRRRTSYTVAALILNGIAMVPFLPGHGFHDYAESWGTAVVGIFALLIGALCFCILFLKLAWQANARLR